MEILILGIYYIMKYHGATKRERREKQRAVRGIYKEVSKLAERTATVVQQQHGRVVQPPSVNFLQQKAMGNFPTQCEACKRRWFY